MRPKNKKPLVVTKVEFSSSKDAGNRLRRVYELLLAQCKDAEESGHNHLKDSGQKMKGGTEMEQS